LGDAFIGYQDDTTAAVVFQAYHSKKAFNAAGATEEQPEAKVSF